MTVWFVTRHPGALDWAKAQGLRVDRHTSHLDVQSIQPGDTVIGTLPVHLAALVCAKGAVFFNFTIDLPPEWRGCELDVDQLDQFNARLERYQVTLTDA
jgi:CRISPR-associated protein Csx16